MSLHNRYFDRKVNREVEHDISEIGLAISEYGRHLNQILACLKSHLKHGANTKDIMILKVRDAIECAAKFEETIKHLIKEEKYIE